MDFAESLGRTGALVEAELDRLLRGPMAAGVPERLAAAMRHAVLGGGKRLRPFLVLETAQLFDIGADAALPAALAVELIHGYSLVHDDLPAMDDDEMRRGRPTVWKEFDEWTAILAGDGLQALAFEVLATPPAGSNQIGGGLAGEVRARLIVALAEASGVRGMVGGQALDLEADKLGNPRQPHAGHIRRLQAMKTGALIRVSCEAGAVIARATDKDRSALRSYGTQLGLAFQIADDLLDVEGDAATVGKAVAKDAAAGKATLVSLIGLDAAKTELSRAVSEAKAAVAPFGRRAERLVQAAEFVAARDK
ncbi:MAG: polyprenyl synthetase family protein [Alphaproteobacteria bacterium]|nr:polyprenyl synthetase family protein [Alphaproteobacteria bacterium]